MLQPAASDDAVYLCSMHEEDEHEQTAEEEHRVQQGSIPRNDGADRDKTWIFIYLLLSNAFMYLEAGTVPAMLLHIARSFSMSPASQGLLGGIVYLSLCIGGPVAGYCLRKYEKLQSKVLALAVTGNAVWTLIWALTPVNYSYSASMFILLRFIMGLNQSIICVYLPIWTNEYAPNECKATWFALMQASVPIGCMGGYIIAAIILHHRTSLEEWYGGDFGIWRYPLLIEVILLLPMCIGFLFIESTEFQINLSNHQSSTTTINPISSDETESFSKINETKNPVSATASESFSEIKDILIYLFHLPLYKYIVGAMTCLYFVVTGVQYWVPSYMLVAINSSVSLVNFSFILCVGSSSICGIMFGGWIVDYLGGYKNESNRLQALKICTFFGLISVICAIAILFTSELWEFVTLLWILLYFGASVLPSCSGIIVAIVPNQYKAVASGANLMIFNLFGYFLSLTLSGLLMQILLQFKSNCDYVCARENGFRLIMLWSIFSFTFLALSLESSVNFFSASFCEYHFKPPKKRNLKDIRTNEGRNMTIVSHQSSNTSPSSLSISTNPAYSPMRSN